MLWLFKIFAVPILVALATLAIRRWGGAIGGLLTGLPFLTGPISYFLALDQGIDFAIAANTGVILTVAASAHGQSPFIGSRARSNGRCA